MTRFTDGVSILDIEMKTLGYYGYGPCIEHDVFQCGSLRHNDELDCYEVENVYELAKEADKWSAESNFNSAVYTLYSGWDYVVSLGYNYNTDDENPPKKFELTRYLHENDSRDIEYEYVESANFDELGLDNNSDMTSVIAAIDAYLEDAIGFTPEYEVVW